jgi:hypothetical protein
VVSYDSFRPAARFGRHLAAHLPFHRILGLRKALCAFCPTPTFSSLLAALRSRLLCSAFIAFLKDNATLSNSFSGSRPLDSIIVPPSLFPRCPTDLHPAILVRVRRRQAVCVPGPHSGLQNFELKDEAQAVLNGGRLHFACASSPGFVATVYSVPFTKARSPFSSRWLPKVLFMFLKLIQ